MSEHNPKPDALERIEELWTQRATAGLDADETAELERLLRETGRDQDDPGFDEAAALLARQTVPAATLPATLAQKIQADADEFFRPSDWETEQRDPATPRAASDAGAPARPVLAFIGGALSAAAALAVVFGLWQIYSLNQRGAFIDDERQAQASDWQTTPWSVFQDGYGDVTGEVVWSREQQGGLLRLAGLPKNDPDEAQYQLWIVDPQRDAEPVDGGVFDMPDTPAGGDVTVAFSAKLPVDRPTAFAITLEKPGGVVVSEGPLLVTALLPKG